MADYHATHLRMFNAITDAIRTLDDTSDKLAKVQQEVESMVLNAPEDNLTVLGRPEELDKEND